MLQIENESPLAVTLFPNPDPDGVDCVYTVVKGTYRLGDALSLADEQLPITMAAAYFDDPGSSSIRAPSDISLTKPGTDVVLLGSAWAPGGRPTWQTDVSLSAGPLRKALRVFADRVWDAGPAGASISWVAPFVRLPLVWERAYGGRDETDAGPTAEPRNPVGRGFRAPKGTKPLSGSPLPNIEDPAAPIASPSDTPAPVGFGPVAAHWEPRKSFAGTYDEAWQRRRAPYLPTDFDPRFFQIAPAGLSASRYLQPGELVEVRGASESGYLRFALPAATPRVTYVVDRKTERRPANLDTVVIEPDLGRVILVWRAELPCDKKVLRVSAVRVTVTD